MDTQTMVLNVRATLREPLADFLTELDAIYAHDQENKNYAFLRHNLADSLRNTLTNMGDFLNPDYGHAKKYGIEAGQEATVARFKDNIAILNEDKTVPSEIKKPLADALERVVGIVDTYCAEVAAASQGPDSPRR